MVITHQQKIDPDTLKNLYPNHSPGKYVMQDRDIDILAESYLTKRAESDRLKQEAEKEKTLLLAIIKDSEGLNTRFGTFTYRKSCDSTRVNYQALVEFLNPPPEIVRQFTETVPGTRRFLTPVNH